MFLLIVLLYSLPHISITTIGGEMPTADPLWNAQHTALGITNANKVPGRMVMTHENDTLYDSKHYVEDKSGITIKVRGNSSSAFGHYRYKLKLQKKADLLRRDDAAYKDKEWLLLRENAMRFREGLLVSQLIGMEWTPAYEYVTVSLNDSAMGVFMLTEAVKISDKRVPVPDGGALMEYDAYFWNEPYSISTNYYNYGYTFKDPSPVHLSNDEKQQWEWRIYCLEESFRGWKRIEDCIDVPSFARWILAHDILGMGDAAGSNFYMACNDAYNEDERFRAPLLWDFDSTEETPGRFCNMHCNQMYADMFNQRNDTLLRAYINEWKRIEPFLFDKAIADIQLFGETEMAEALQASGQPGFEIEKYVPRQTQWFQNRRVTLSRLINELEDGIDSPHNTATNTTAYDISGYAPIRQYNRLWIQRLTDGRTQKILNR